MRKTSDALEWGLAGAVSVAILVALVLPLLATTPGHSGDSIEFQFLSETHGLAHPPGSPVYVSVAWLWRHALGPWIDSPALAANSFSLLCAALVFALAVGLCRAWEWSVLPTVLGLLAMLCSPLLLKLSAVAELYVPALAVSLGCIYLTQLWAKNGRRRYLILAGLVLGLGAGVHPSVLFVGPSCFIIVLSRTRQPWRLRHTWEAAGALTLGLFICLGTIALISALPSKFVYTPIVSASSLLDFVTGRQFHDHAGAFTADELLSDRLPNFLDAAFGHVGWLGAFAVYGLVASIRQTQGLALLAWFAICGFYVTNYGVDDVWDFVLPAQLAVALWCVAGVSQACKLVRHKRFAAPTLFAIATLALAPSLLSVPDARRELRDELRDDSVFRLAERRWDAVSSNSILASGSWLDSCALWYLRFTRVRDDGPSVAHALRASDLVEYAAGSRDILLAQERRTVPTGRDLYLVGDAYSQDLLGAGMHLYRQDDGLYLVRARRDDSLAGTHLDPQRPRCRFVEGWGPAEGWGRWMLAQEATVEIENPTDAANLRIRASTWHADQPAPILVLSDGQGWSVRRTIDSAPWGPIEFTVPLPASAGRESLTLSLTVDSLHMAPGDRARALAVQEISVD